MTRWQCLLKRSCDVCLATLGLAVFGWLILACWVIATIDTRQNGFFTQERIGKDNRRFRIIKIRSMRPLDGVTTVVTSSNDPRITRVGNWLRRLKLDELPQLVNVLLGHMSFVGPRPDTAEYTGLLQGEDRIILSVRPGITGPASLAFRNEEKLLAGKADPERYNREVIFPTKVRMNLRYIETYSLHKDILYILATVIPGLRRWVVPPFEPASEA